MTIAIYGLSCSSKTAVARILGMTSGRKVRHCGQVIKDWASRHAVTDLAKLPRWVHEEIDSGTREFAMSEGRVVEGCFLDCVLASTQHVILVELTCAASERANRLRQKVGIINAGSELRGRDTADAAIRAMLYGGSSARTPHAVFDTTSSTISNTADQILNFVNILRASDEPVR